MPSDLCKVCGREEAKFLFETTDRIYGLPGLFKVLRCSTCGLIRLKPALTEKELELYYPANYYAYENSEPMDFKRLGGNKYLYYLRHPVRGLNALFYSKVLGQNKDLPVFPGCRVLDVGCGEGRYLLEKRKTGSACFGVDINADALDRLRRSDPGIEIFCGNLWDAGYPSDYFDVINISHVLEHIPSFEKFLPELWRILKTNGRIRLVLPIVDALSPLLWGKIWIGFLDIPRHVFIYSVKNLKILLSKYGLKIVRWRTIENSYSMIGGCLSLWGALQHRTVDLMKSRRIWNSECLKLLFVPYALLVNWLRIGDMVEFILTKGGVGPTESSLGSTRS